MADKNVSIDITAQDRTKAAFDSVKRNLGDVGGAVKGVVSGFAALGVGAALVSVARQAVQAATEAEQSQNRLNAVLRATGNTSGFTAGQLDAMTESLERISGFDGEGIRDAQATLLKFGNLNGEVFDRALKAAADYAAFAGTDIPAAAQLIGRALSDPIRGVGLLERQFGSLTFAQKESIQAFIEQGRIAEAQAVIFEKLEGAIGGTAGSMNTGLFGAANAAKKAYGDLMEELGRAGPTKIVVENSLLSMAGVMNVLSEAIKNANKEVEKSIFFQGKLDALPDAKGRKPKPLTVEEANKLTPNLPVMQDVPDLSGMTEEEVQARLRAWDAQQEAGRAAAAEEQAKKAIELAKAQAKAREQELKDGELLANMKQFFAAEQEQSMAQTMQNERDYRAEQLRLALQWEANKDFFHNQQESAKAETLALMEQEDAAKAEAAQRSYLRLMESLTSERGLLEQDYADKMLLLKQWVLDRNAELVAMHEKGVLDEFEFNQRRIANNAQYYGLAKKVEDKYLQDRRAAKLAAYKQEHQLSEAYDKLDLQSTAAFGGHMAVLMHTNSRKMFEIGKVGAISEVLAKTPLLALKSFLAFAEIPFVGPVLGAAAAAAAIAYGAAQVQAIRSTSFGGGGGGGGGAVGTFNVSPSTGLPEPVSTGLEAPQSPIVQAATPVRRDINVTIQGEGVFTAETIRDKLIPLLNDAIGDGVVLRAV